ncbi:hypothetical protein L9F63_002098, partial [Diploptera punctata]
RLKPAQLLLTSDNLIILNFQFGVCTREEVFIYLCLYGTNQFSELENYGFD